MKVSFIPYADQCQGFKSRADIGWFPLRICPSMAVEIHLHACGFARRNNIPVFSYIFIVIGIVTNARYSVRGWSDTLRPWNVCIVCAWNGVIDPAAESRPGNYQAGALRRYFPKEIPSCLLEAISVKILCEWDQECDQSRPSSGSMSLFKIVVNLTWRRGWVVARTRKKLENMVTRTRFSAFALSFWDELPENIIATSDGTVKALHCQS